jgi:hypothetical protein
VCDAKAIKEKDPELFEQVMAGEIKVSEAQFELTCSRSTRERNIRSYATVLLVWRMIRKWTALLRSISRSFRRMMGRTSWSGCTTSTSRRDDPRHVRCKTKAGPEG